MTPDTPTRELSMKRCVKGMLAQRLTQRLTPLPCVLICVLHSLASIAANVCVAEETPPPNVVFFLIDDLGWKDLQAYGAEVYETPNMDQLVAAGTRFTNAYSSAPVCSPARGAALSGVHSIRLGMWNARHHIPRQTPTLPQYLQKAGYAAWHVGKWHMGSEADGNTPLDMGFDVNIGGFTSFAPGSHYWPYGVTIDENGQKQYSSNASVPDLYEDGKEDEYLADRLTDEAIQLIEERDRSKPFFLNFWHYAVHAKHEGRKDLVKKYEKKIADLGIVLEMGRTDPATKTSFVTTEAYPVYAAMIESVDQSIGRVIAKLKEEGVYENTLIVFYSDNGPLTDKVPCVPLMGGKNSTYEAGIRVPASVSWPGKIPAGAVNDERVIIMDVLPTVLDAVGIEIPETEELDGVSLMPVVHGDPITQRDFYWYFPSDRYKWGQRACTTILGKDGFKYILFLDGSKDELYDINHDLAERDNIIDSHPERASELRENLIEYLRKHYTKLGRTSKVYADAIESILRNPS